MGTKAKAKHTPAAAIEKMAAPPPLDDDARKVVRSLDPSSPFCQEMAAQQERLRLIGEKLGLNRIAETLRKAKTAPAEPQEPTPHQPKRGRAGRKRSLAPEQIEEGIRILRGKPKMSVKAARQTLRDAGIEGEDGPLYRLIIKPAYGGMSK